MSDSAASLTDPQEASQAAYDVERYRRDFPILTQTMNGKPLVFLDSAASAQKPRQVIDAVSHVYEAEYANVHRGAYALSARATEAYEGARSKVRGFLNAARDSEIIFTKNATESINLVANTYGRKFLQPGDEIIISTMEHHSNIVPWQMLRDEKGLVLKAVPITDDGEFMLSEFKNMLSSKTKLVAITHTSNALGTVTPAAEIARAEKPYFPKIDEAVLGDCIGSYQKLGCWTPHVEITQQAYEATLDIYEFNDGIRERYSYDQICSLPPAG